MTKFKTLVITGANRGLGLEFVNYYAQQAIRVIACCRDPENAHELNALCHSFSNIELLPLNVTHQHEITGLSSHLGESAVDLLINNAGVGASRDTKAVFDSESWKKVFEINCIAPIQIANALSPNLSFSEHAVVANITSKMGSISDNESGGAEIYRSSKAALNAATKSYAIEQINNGITTILLHPGWVRTDMGGPNGLIDIQTSIQGMTKVIENVGQTHNGQFFDYQGEPIAW